MLVPIYCQITPQSRQFPTKFLNKPSTLLNTMANKDLIDQRVGNLYLPNKFSSEKRGYIVSTYHFPSQIYTMKFSQCTNETPLGKYYCILFEKSVEKCFALDMADLGTFF